MLSIKYKLSSTVENVTETSDKDFSFKDLKYRGEVEHSEQRKQLPSCPAAEQTVCSRPDLKMGFTASPFISRPASDTTSQGLTRVDRESRLLIDKRVRTLRCVRARIHISEPHWVAPKPTEIRGGSGQLWVAEDCYVF